jgi:hypothetical protein
MTTDNLLDNEIPAKFKDSATGEIRLNDFAKSYAELEKKLSSRSSAPKTPDDYCVDCSHGLFGSDDEANKRFHVLGLTQEQVQGVYDVAAEKMVPMVMLMAADYQAEHELEKLVTHFGGADAWREISRQLLAYGQKTFPADVLDTLASSFDGVVALHRMMKGQDPQIAKATDARSNMAEMDLQSMMRDPKYWRDQDPAFVAKVTEGFKRMYGGK